MSSIAIIPARGGSKRIPRKNIKDFLGKPIIAYAIATALESRCFSEVIVSTDDEAIADIAKQYGASVPFMRPLALSDDTTPTAPVINHAIEALGLDSNDLVCAIYPTAALLQTSTLQRAFEALEKNPQYHFCFSAAAFAYNPLRGFYIGALSTDSTLESSADCSVDSSACVGTDIAMLCSDNYHVRSQDLKPLYHDAGQFYLAKACAWGQNLPIFSPTSCAIVLESSQVQDIDTTQDWLLAQMKYKMLHSL